MKQRMLQLIGMIDNVEKCFHHTMGGFGSLDDEQIYDVPEFQNWIQELQFELQDIVERTGDTFASDALEAVNSFNGWSDRKNFSEVKGKLLAIKRNIHRYYETNKNEGEDPKKQQQPKVFISHSSKDVDYVKQIVALLDGLGLDQTQMFCSSLPGYDVPVNTNIFDCLYEQFSEYDLHVIFVHSSNYYTSPISLNEMGAAWVLKRNYTSILLPGFDFGEMKGVVNAGTIAIKLDSNEAEVKDKLNQLYDIITNEFGLDKKADITWEQKRNNFIQEIASIHQVRNNTISVDGVVSPLSAGAAELLKIAANDAMGQILKIQALGGTQIQAGQRSMNKKGNPRDTAKWESALSELITTGFVNQVDERGEVFQVTQSGYELVERKG